MERISRIGKFIATNIVLFMSGFSSIFAQDADTDTLVMSTTLHEVVVQSPQILQFGNRSIYYPPQKLKEAMNTSSQLLAGMQIPELIVNPATGNISISRGGNLSIRINGRPASETELMAISAMDITKVEYIANPGTRYGNATAVLDISVERRNDNYGVVLNLLQSPNRGWGDYTMALKYNTGRSEWSADYHSNPMWNIDCYRNNYEIINIPEAATIKRSEEGIKTPNRMVMHRASMQYSYAYKSSLLFNVQARLIRQDDRFASLGTIITDLNNTLTQGVEKEISPFAAWQADLDFYLHWKINPKHIVYFNLVPTAISSTSDRIYEADDVSISSRIKNHGTQLLTEGFWEGKIGNGTMIAGVRAKLLSSRAIYAVSETSMHDNFFEGNCFAEWNQRFDKFRYSIGIDGSWFRLTQPTSRNFTRLSPRFSVSFSPISRVSINMYLDAASTNPTASQLNPVEQRIDRFQYSIGSLSLKSYMTYKSKLEFNFNVKALTAGLTFADNYSFRPIMAGKTYAANKIIQSYYNAGSHNEFIIKGHTRTPLFLKQLTLSVEGGWHRITSNGMEYHHSYSQPFVNAQLMYVTGQWWFMIKYNNTYNMLWGEIINSVNNNLLNLGVGYRHKAAVFMVGLVNPIGNVNLKSWDLSSLAGYERTYHAASTNCLVWIGVSWNINKGLQSYSERKKLHNKYKYESIKNVQK